MDRLISQKRQAGMLFLLAALALVPMLLTQTGCASALAGMLYVVRGNTIKADFEELKGKRVAIVCRAPSGLSYGIGNVGNDLSRQLSAMLKQKIRRIEIIAPEQIAQWTDENEWDDFTEVGKALKADMVVGIEVEQFGLHRGQTLYQGQAKLSVKVYDMKQGGEVVYNRNVPQLLYPPNMGIATSEITAEDFRRTFVGVVADTIGRSFYSHDAHADVARDADVLKFN